MARKWWQRKEGTKPSKTPFGQILERIPTGEDKSVVKQEEAVRRQKPLAPERRYQEEEAAPSIEQLEASVEKETFHQERMPDGTTDVWFGKQERTDAVNLTPEQYAGFYRRNREGATPNDPLVIELRKQKKIANAVKALKQQQLQQELLAKGMDEEYEAALRDLELLPSQMTTDQARKFLSQADLTALGIESYAKVGGTAAAPMAAMALITKGAATFNPYVFVASVAAASGVYLAETARGKQRDVRYGDRIRADIEKALPDLEKNLQSGATSPEETVKRLNLYVGALQAANAIMKEQEDDLVGSTLTDAQEKRREVLDILNDIIPQKQDTIRHLIRHPPPTQAAAPVAVAGGQPIGAIS